MGALPALPGRHLDPGLAPECGLQGERDEATILGGETLHVAIRDLRERRRHDPLVCGPEVGIRAVEPGGEPSDGAALLRPSSGSATAPTATRCRAAVAQQSLTTSVICASLAPKPRAARLMFFVPSVDPEASSRAMAIRMGDSVTPGR